MWKTLIHSTTVLLTSNVLGRPCYEVTNINTVGFSRVASRTPSDASTFVWINGVFNTWKRGNRVIRCHNCRMDGKMGIVVVINMQ
jgi:hypothetical protein